MSPDTLRRKIFYAVLGVILLAGAVTTYLLGLPNAGTFIGFLGGLALLEVL